MKNYFLIHLIFLSTSQLVNSTEPLCDISNCFGEAGECANGVCLCSAGYTTRITELNDYEKNTNEFTFCNYVYKYKSQAAYFEGLLPFGVGHFYTQRYLHALLKFVLFWFLSFNKILFKKRKRLWPFIEKCYSISVWVFGILYVGDYLCFIFNFYRDGNGMILLD